MRRFARLARSVVLAMATCATCCPAQEVQQTAPAQTEAPQADGMPQPHGPVRPKAPKGTLTGTVYCADTNLPARLAAIYLVQISESSFSTNSAAISDLEGRFALNHVTEGEYYVVAVLPGYLNMMSSLAKSHLDALTADDRKKFLAQVPSVTISANQPAQLSLRLERGAEIDGTVMYDDGSPAIGLRMNFKLKAAQESNGMLPQMMDSEGIFYSQMGPPMTDDRGHFRILGVPPGEYVVSAALPAESAEHANENQAVEMIEASIGAIDVYLGGGLRASKAETVKVTAGGASKDADITIPLSKLHTIRGQVVLKSTGQPPPSAMVQLLYADTEEPARMTIAADGEFEIHYVPEGSFILRAMAMAKSVPKMETVDDDDSGVGFVSGGMSFALANPKADFPKGDAELPLLITGDVDGVTITVPEPPASHQETPDGNQGQGISADGPSDNPQ
jgi:hypothetical protein